jgi:hypothetical protein
MSPRVFWIARVGNAPLGVTGVTRKKATACNLELLWDFGAAQHPRGAASEQRIVIRWTKPCLLARWLLIRGSRILVNPLPRLSRRRQYARPKETLRINVFLLAHGQRNRDVGERTIQKSDDQIRFTGHRCMYRISGQ